MKIIELDTVGSTNTYALDYILKNKEANEILIFTHSQTSGKGLEKNTWHTENNKNLIFSMIVSPDIKIEDHFLISMITSLGICEYCENKGVFSKIKWPNDIYYGEKKLCGILIENTVYGDTIKKSVLGAGINLNQVDFPVYLPNPVSISNITGLKYDLTKEINEVSRILLKNLRSLQRISFEETKRIYLSKLFRYEEWNDFKIKDKLITAKIIDLKSSGHIVLEHKSGENRAFYFKEIEYCI